MSALNVNTINGVDVQNLASKVARAWVNFNGIGTVAIRKALNVASVTDNGVGDYTINFTAALPDANYAVMGSPILEAASSGNGLWRVNTAGKLANGVRVGVVNAAGAALDTDQNSFVFFD